MLELSSVGDVKRRCVNEPSAGSSEKFRIIFETLLGSGYAFSFSLVKESTHPSLPVNKDVEGVPVILRDSVPGVSGLQ